MTIALEQAGYSVLATGSPTDALALARERPDIDLLLTDVVMPEMDGTGRRAGSSSPRRRKLAKHEIGELLAMLSSDKP